MTKLSQAAVSFVLLFLCVACAPENNRNQNGDVSVEQIDPAAVDNNLSHEIAEEEAVALLDEFARETLHLVSQQKSSESEQSSVDELESLSEADRQALQNLVADEATGSAQQQATTEVERVKANKNIEQVLRDIELDE